MSRVLKTGVNKITWNFGENHGGIDIVKSPMNLDYIVAHSDGEVVEVVKNYNKTDTTGHSYGNYVKIKHGNGYYTLYAHMKYGSVTVNKGDKVSKGQVLGYMGATGRATGGHLHFEVRTPNDIRINPKTYIDADLPSATQTATQSDTQTTNAATQSGTQYRVHIKGGNWLPWVSKADDTANGYAGLFGKAIDGIQVKGRNYQVHTLNGSWLSEVSKVDDTSNGYAGIYGKSIDGIKIKNAMYRVHIKNGNWLPWVSKVDNTSNGYAGIYGKEIDGIQIKPL